jgi:hypothetical protein
VCTRCWKQACIADSHKVEIPWETEKSDQEAYETEGHDVAKVVVHDKTTFFEEDRWYRLAMLYDANQHKLSPKGLALRSCAVCETQQVVVWQSEIDKYCRKNQRCVNAHCRATVFVWTSSGSYFKSEDGQYEWSGEGETSLPIEEVWDTDVIDQMQADKPYMKSQKCVALNHLVVFTEYTGPITRIRREAKQYIYSIYTKVQTRLLRIWKQHQSCEE